MTADCVEMRLLVQADVDGELRPAEAARVAAHVLSCGACAAVQTSLIGLSARLQQDAPRYMAPAGLRAAIEGRLPTLAPAPAPAPVPASLPASAPARSAAPFRLARRPVFGGGLALAACALLLLAWPRPDAMPGAIVTSHLRALQPGHLMDVVSTDQHTVKPWFDGRLDYAPPVKDFAAQGFPLEGGRLDALTERPVAVLVYGRRQHAIDLYVIPGGGAPRDGAISGYNFMSWSEGDFTLWAVSDLNSQELSEFVRLWRAG